ncbi:MAG TPA: sigma-70 family RNA polymerase sigma factor [Vitreimonas sp.]|uniref:sigma-70 family RNA polymerase sigma factor n=1 Tax=Vitreimonas sp. TaxID=3069702 RepID=UPI002D66FFDC|nr:sigma-70 family RNA polymerase sigma factor [Vitreimonas sp.]HYD85999.1 sigma-70 family RNA polymerase sigma factor [Vitreimonas sp.]
MSAVAPGAGLALLRREALAEASLWRRLRLEHDRSCRELLFDRHLSFARKIANGEFRRRPAYGLERRDFEQLAIGGLLESIDRFDPMLGPPFEAFARPRIRGAISDGLARSSEAAAHFSWRKRTEAERLRSLTPSERSGDAMTQLAEIASGLALGLLAESAARLLEQQPARELDAYESLAWRELQLNMLSEMEQLPAAQRTVLQKHYLDGVEFAAIAELMNVSRGRISQLHRAGLMALRERLRYKE